METVWQSSNLNRLLPNASNYIIDLISSYLALSLTDLALLLGSTTKSFEFMPLLSGRSGISCWAFFRIFLRVSLQ